MNKTTLIYLGIGAVILLVAIFAFTYKPSASTTTTTDKSVAHGGAGSTIGDLLSPFT